MISIAMIIRNGMVMLLLNIQKPGAFFTFRYTWNPLCLCFLWWFEAFRLPGVVFGMKSWGVLVGLFGLGASGLIVDIGFCIALY